MNVGSRFAELFSVRKPGHARSTQFHNMSRSFILYSLIPYIRFFVKEKIKPVIRPMVRKIKKKRKRIIRIGNRNKVTDNGAKI